MNIRTVPVAAPGCVVYHPT